MNMLLARNYVLFLFVTVFCSGFIVIGMFMTGVMLLGVLLGSFEYPQIINNLLHIILCGACSYMMVSASNYPEGWESTGICAEDGSSNLDGRMYHLLGVLEVFLLTVFTSILFMNS